MGGEMAKDFATASLSQLEGLWEVVELPVVVRNRGRVLAMAPLGGMALWGRGAGLVSLAEGSGAVV